MGQVRPRPVVLDAGAFIAFEKRDRRILTLIERALHTRAPLHAPAGVIAQVWRDGGKQVRLARLVNAGVIEIRELDLEEAQAAGALCGRNGTKDVINASVALLARRVGGVVVTRDPDDLRRIDPHVEVVTC